MVNIKNKKVLQQLEQYGDDLKQSRQVLHWAYFKNQEDRHALIREAEQLGYQLGWESEHKGHERPYGVCIHKIHNVDQNSVDLIFTELTEAAESCGGEYDGWEAEIIRAVQ